MTLAAIRIDAVNKTLGSTHAVRDLDLVVPEGSLCGFLGPNGAGKSTTIRMIMSIIYPDSGAVEVLGATALAAKDRIGYLPEERGVYRKMRVGEFLHYIATLKGMGGRDLNQRIADWLERVDLGEVSKKKCEELSKGMQQKVQFLAAIIHEPELLILDEPFSGLDPVNAELLNELIRELNATGTTIIFSTHVLEQAEAICDRIFLINKGRKLLDATLDEVREQFDPRTILVDPMNGSLDVEGVPGIRDSRLMEHSSSIELELSEGADPHEVMRNIMDVQPVRSVELRRLTLNEVFVQVVKSDLGEAAADQAREELRHA